MSGIPIDRPARLEAGRGQCYCLTAQDPCSPSLAASSVTANQGIDIDCLQPQNSQCMSSKIIEV